MNIALPASLPSGRNNYLWMERYLFFQSWQLDRRSLPLEKHTNELKTTVRLPASDTGETVFVSDCQTVPRNNDKKPGEMHSAVSISKAFQQS